MMLEGHCLCGKAGWTFDGDPESATACNCTVCRRYGVLWIYDWEGERIAVTGETRVWQRRAAEIGFHFCADCGCVTWWRALAPDPDGRRRIAVNLRLVTDPARVAALPIQHFDGLDRFEDLPDDGRTVGDMWF